MKFVKAFGWSARTAQIVAAVRFDMELGTVYITSAATQAFEVATITWRVR
jgi:hypothetical protein